MKKVLFGYDGSDCSKAALRGMERMGLPRELEMRVTSVAEVWLPPDGRRDTPGELPETVRRARERAMATIAASEAAAEGAAAELAGAHGDWRIQGEAIMGSPVWTLCRAANDWPADLVVVGSHGRSVLGQMILGSVAQGVAAGARCSVHIARPRPTPAGAPLRLMVAVDGSADSDAAVRAVAGRCWPEGTTIQTVTVIDPHLETSANVPTLYAQEWIDRHDADANQWVCRFVEQAAGWLRETGMRVESHVFEGDAKQLLVKQVAAAGVDCLFVGARGLDHGNRRYLGTTTAAISARATCSVEIVRQR